MSGDPDALVGSSLLRNAGNTYQVELVPSNDGGFFVFWNDGGQPFGAEFGASGIQRQPTTLIEDGWGGFNWVTAPIPDSDRLLLLRSGYNSDTHSYETFAEVRLSQGFGGFPGQSRWPMVTLDLATLRGLKHRSRETRSLARWIVVHRFLIKHFPECRGEC